LRISQVSTAGHGYGRHEVSVVQMGFFVVDPSTGDLTALQAKSPDRNQHPSTTNHFLNTP
jgi:hypothetical protein